MGTSGPNIQEAASRLRGQGWPQILGKSSLDWATQDTVSDTKQDQINNTKKVLWFPTAWINLEDIILSKIAREAFLNFFPKAAKCKLYVLIILFY